MRRAGEVVSKSEILDNVWDFAFEGDPNIVEVYVRHLRKKLDEPFDRQAHRDDPRRRLPTRPGEAAEAVRRFATVRVRITLAAVLVVGLALAVGGAWLVGAHRDSLTQNVETAARLRSRDIAATIDDGEFPATLAVPRGDENLVQVVDAGGRVVATSANLEGDARIRTVAAGTGWLRGLDRWTTWPAGDGPFRDRGPARRHQDGNVHGLRRRQPRRCHRQHRQPRATAADRAARAPAARRGHHVGRHRPRAAAGRVDPPRGRSDRRRGSPPAGPRAGDRRRDRAAGADDERDARPARERHRPSTSVRRRRQPRAPQPAHRHPRAARGRPRAPERADWQATERDVLDDTIRLQRLVDDLLALATVDASALDASHREPVDLDEIVLQRGASTPESHTAPDRHDGRVRRAARRRTRTSSCVPSATCSTTRRATPVRRSP